MVKLLLDEAEITASSPFVAILYRAYHNDVGGRDQLLVGDWDRLTAIGEVNC